MRDTTMSHKLKGLKLVKEFLPHRGGVSLNLSIFLRHTLELSREFLRPSKGFLTV